LGVEDVFISESYSGVEGCGLGVLVGGMPSGVGWGF